MNSVTWPKFLTSFFEHDDNTLAEADQQEQESSKSSSCEILASNRDYIFHLMKCVKRQSGSGEQVCLHLDGYCALNELRQSCWNLPSAPWMLRIVAIVNPIICSQPDGQGAADWHQQRHEAKLLFYEQLILSCVNRRSLPFAKVLTIIASFM